MRRRDTSTRKKRPRPAKGLGQEGGKELNRKRRSPPSRREGCKRLVSKNGEKILEFHSNHGLAVHARDGLEGALNRGRRVSNRGGDVVGEN